ncbi:D-glycerate dehydrogenase [Candidatus Gracilibacteria bacterium]|nr:D-glycerate dehydrogenase [Candidatus Gracilibacteria bacterium]
MKKAFITRRLPDEALAIVAAACNYEIWDSAEEPVPRALLLEKLRDADGVLCLISDRVDAEVLDHAPRLRIVANMAVGYDNIDLAALRARGVALTNTPDVLTDATADLAWALLLAAARRVVEGQKLIEADSWRYWAPLFMVGQDLQRATLAVVGAGRIGAAVLRRAQGFNMRLIYHNRRPNAELEAQTGASYRTFAALLQEADFIVVTVPLSAETRGMFGASEFALMKPNAVFVNVARGPIVDEAALYEALKAGRPWAVGLDVFANEPIRADHPLLTLPNVVAVPHIGSATLNTRIAMATLAARNLAAALTDQPLITPVVPGA